MALRANRRNHLVVLPDEELEVVRQRTEVVLLQASPETLGGRCEGTGEVVMVEGVDGWDGGVTVRAEGAGELEVEGG